VLIAVIYEDTTEDVTCVVACATDADDCTGDGGYVAESVTGISFGITDVSCVVASTIAGSTNAVDSVTGAAEGTTRDDTCAVVFDPDADVDVTGHAT